MLTGSQTAWLIKMAKLICRLGKHELLNHFSFIAVWTARRNSTCIWLLSCTTSNQKSFEGIHVKEVPHRALDKGITWLVLFGRPIPHSWKSEGFEDTHTTTCAQTHRNTVSKCSSFCLILLRRAEIPPEISQPGLYQKLSLLQHGSHLWEFSPQTRGWEQRQLLSKCVSDLTYNYIQWGKARQSRLHEISQSFREPIRRQSRR